MITGIICEYNPLHKGHKKQLDWIRAADPDGVIVCLMSGNYVQRGKPAVFDKMLRAKAAVLCGADLVLELPIGYALSSAEGFAAGGNLCAWQEAWYDVFVTVETDNFFCHILVGFHIFTESRNL